MTPREAFCAVLSNGPLVYGDAIIVLSGDGTTRLEVALELFKQKAAPFIVVSGGVDNPPHALTAKASAEWLIDKGLAPDRIITEGGSLETHAQAGNIISMTVAKKWPTLLLATSPYHQYRAFLTFLRELRDFALERKVRLINIPASQTKWFDSPEGIDTTRVDLLKDEFEKIDEYRAKGHVASYEDGLDYLKYWEAKPVEPKS